MVVGYQHFRKLPYMYVYLLIHYLPHRIHETGIFTYMHHEHQPNIGQYTIYPDPIGTVDGEGNSMEHNFLDVKHIFNKSCDQTTVQVPVLLTGAWLLPAVVVGKYVPPCDYFLRLKKRRRNPWRSKECNPTLNPSIEPQQKITHFHGLLGILIKSYIKNPHISG